MIEFVNNKSIERVRRFTIFARSVGDVQYNIVEASLFTWSHNWMVIPIEGSGLSLLKFEYPNWLHNLYQAFGATRPDPKSTKPNEAYERLEANKDIRVFKSIDKLKSELNWTPDGQCQSADSWLAVYLPAGRITLPPFAFKFNKGGAVKQNRIGSNSDALWIPMTDKADKCRVFFQTGHPHLESPDYENENWSQSQYQACIFTRAKLTRMMVAPLEDYFSWTVPQVQMRSQWMPIEKATTWKGGKSKEV